MFRVILLHHEYIEFLELNEHEWQSKDIKYSQADELFNNHKKVDHILMEGQCEKSIFIDDKDKAFAKSEGKKLVKIKNREDNANLNIIKGTYINYIDVNATVFKKIKEISRRYNKPLVSIKSFLFDQAINSNKVVYMQLGDKVFWSSKVNNKLIYKISDDLSSLIISLSDQVNIRSKPVIELYLDDITLKKSRYKSNEISNKTVFISAMILLVGIALNNAIPEEIDHSAIKEKIYDIEKKLSLINKIENIEIQKKQKINWMLNTLAARFGNINNDNVSNKIKVDTVLLTPDSTKLTGNLSVLTSRDDWLRKTQSDDEVHIHQEIDPFSIYSSGKANNRFFEITISSHKNEI